MLLGKLNSDLANSYFERKLEWEKIQPQKHFTKKEVDDIITPAFTNLNLPTINVSTL